VGAVAEDVDEVVDDVDDDDDEEDDAPGASAGADDWGPAPVAAVDLAGGGSTPAINSNRESGTTKRRAKMCSQSVNLQ
jgi:hypothetical protein